MMAAYGTKLRNWTGDGKEGFMFYCPGCKEPHAVRTNSPDGWTFNGNGDAPTFQPSVLVRTGHHVPDFAQLYPPGVEPSCWCTYKAEHPEDPDPFECVVCHSFVTDGRIQFLADSTHELSGQTVELPDYPERWKA
jgi:hypothetical protein